MATSQARSGFGAKLLRGDGGVGAGTKASKTVGSTNQQIKAEARVAGVAGNSKSFAIVVAGNNTPFSYTVSATSLVINSATDGSAVATTTVDDAIVAIQNDETYRAHWLLSTGVGNGSGVLVASAASNLTGGLDGAEAFTEVPDIRIDTLDETLEFIDVTHSTSPDGYREHIPNLRDGGSLSWEISLIPGNAQHAAMRADFAAGTKRNYRFQLSDGSYYSFSAFVESWQTSSPIDDKLMVSGGLKITGPVNFTVA